jgi:hypothetical protein
MKINLKKIVIILALVSFGAFANWDVPQNITMYDKNFQSNGSQYGIDPILLKAQIAAESRFINIKNPNSAGAVGIAQFLPQTAKELGLNDRTDVQASLNAQARFMASMLKKFNGDYIKALAGYNWGPNRALLKDAQSGYELSKVFPDETRQYLKHIAQAYIAYGGKGTFLKYAQLILNGERSGNELISNSQSAGCIVADPSDFISDSDGYGALPEAPFGDYATMSPLEMILTEADRRLSSDNWQKKITQVSSRALWLDYVKVIAAENYLRHLNYKKKENIEVQLANLVAIKLENESFVVGISHKEVENNFISQNIK